MLPDVGSVQGGVYEKGADGEGEGDGLERYTRQNAKASPLRYRERDMRSEMGTSELRSPAISEMASPAVGRSVGELHSPVLGSPVAELCSSAVGSSGAELHSSTFEARVSELDDSVEKGDVAEMGGREVGRVYSWTQRVNSKGSRGFMGV
jgi:hypothetical protein